MTLEEEFSLLLDCGVTLEEDFALLLDFALELDCGVTLEEDFAELLDATLEEDFALLLDFALELDCGVTLEEDFALDEEFDFTELLLASSQSSHTLDEESSPGRTKLLSSSQAAKNARANPSKKRFIQKILLRYVVYLANFPSSLHPVFIIFPAKKD